MKHLFANLPLDKFDKDDIELALSKDLELTDLTLTFRWTSRKNLLFYKIHTKHNKKIKDQLRSTPKNITDGTYSFHLGIFEDKADIEISFGVMALISVPKLVVLLSQTNPTIGYQAFPKDPGKTHKLASGTRLEFSFKHKVQ